MYDERANIQNFNNKSELANTLKSDLRFYGNRVRDAIEARIGDTEARAAESIRNLELENDGLQRENRDLQRKLKTALEFKEHATCCVCMDEARTVVFRPCSHLCACWGCVQRLRAQATAGNPMLCPICRRAVSETIKVHVV
jgi:hypothetical protein